MKKIFALLLIMAAVFSNAYGYTSSDVATANYLANRNIIKNWSGDPAKYQLDSYAARATVMAILLKMKWTPVNAECRGDFVDVPRSTINEEWTCRIVETAADYGYINAMKNLPLSMRKVRPSNYVTHSEAVGILMKAFNDNGAWAGYSYYWDANFPNDGDNVGYKDAYNFGALWQATIMYSYIRKVLQNDLALRSDPLVNEPARLKTVFGFAEQILN